MTIQWLSLDLSVFVHVLLEVGVEALDFCSLEKADNFKVLAHEYLFLPREFLYHGFGDVVGVTGLLNVPESVMAGLEDRAVSVMGHSRIQI